MKKKNNNMNLEKHVRGFCLIKFGFCIGISEKHSVFLENTKKFKFV